MDTLGARYPRWILDRAFGGIATAVSPVARSQKANWPEGKVAPMSRVACQALVSACRSGNKEMPPCFVFLVGGAGNGKSKIAGDTVEEIDGSLVGGAHRFAQRTYTYDLPNGSALKVVNDATIPPADESDRPALQNDVTHALEAGSHLLACVNRGVLVGEVNNTNSFRSPMEDAAAKISRWLLDAPSEETNGDAVLETQPSDLAHYAFASLKMGEQTLAHIHVVFMDQASLLELWPEDRSSDNSREWDAPLLGQAVNQVPLLKRSSSPGPSAEFSKPLAELAQNFLESSTGGDPELDPILANAASLSQVTAANGWCALLRGAEVVAGSHFTYRELWALASHSLVGPCGANGLSELDHWTEKLMRLCRGSDRAKAALSMVSLSSLRSHMILFDAGREPSPACPTPLFDWPATTNEAILAAIESDPLRNFGPNDGEAYSSFVDKLAGIEDGSRPGLQLANDDPVFSSYWTDFDTRFEEAIATLVEPETTKTTLKERNGILDWYGRYMFRLAALAYGWPAHVSLVSKWQEAWIEARLKRMLPDDIEDALKRIILPRNGDKEAYFPILRSRVDPAQKGGTALGIQVPQGDYRVEIRTSGHNIVAKLKERAAPEGRGVETLLDFHLLREAMASRAGGGFTDSLSVIEPRVERARAGLLAAQSRKQDQPKRFQALLKGRPVEFRMKD